LNDGAATLVGYETGEVIGKSLFDFTPPEYHELAMQIMQSGSSDVWEAELIRKDGSRLPVEVQK
jgi:PAS domain S-box-containing protein